MVEVNDLVEIIYNPDGQFFSPVIEGKQEVDKITHPIFPEYVGFDFVDFEYLKSRNVPERANAYLEIKPAGRLNPNITQMLAEGYKMINYFRIDEKIFEQIKILDKKSRGLCKH